MPATVSPVRTRIWRKRWSISATARTTSLLLTASAPAASLVTALGEGFGGAESDAAAAGSIGVAGLASCATGAGVSPTLCEYEDAVDQKYPARSDAAPTPAANAAIFQVRVEAPPPSRDLGADETGSAKWFSYSQTAACACSSATLRESEEKANSIELWHRTLIRRGIPRQWRAICLRAAGAKMSLLRPPWFRSRNSMYS